MARLTCAERVREAFGWRIEELDQMLRHERPGRLADYALCFEHVAPDTFADQPEGFLRYQISGGGHPDEFRFYVNPDLTCRRAEYWFSHGHDRASLECTDSATVTMLWSWLCDTGAVQAALRPALH